MAIDVSLQVSLLVKTLSTILALVHAHLGMGSQMVRQMCQLLEAPPTFVALVGLLSRVSVAMDLHVNFLMESLSAEVAHKWLVISMRAHMCMQVRRTVEGFVALHAHVRFYGGVRQSVTCQVSRLPKGAATLLTDKWFISSVDAFMSR